MASPMRAYDERLKFWVSADQARRTRIRAATLGLTISDVLRAALDDALARPIPPHNQRKSA
jgi:hypothetical protein